MNPSALALAQPTNYDIKAIQLYHPAGKKEIRLVYRVFAKDKTGVSTRHQKSFSMTKYGEQMAWAKAREAFSHIERTGQLPTEIDLPASALMPAQAARRTKGKAKPLNRMDDVRSEMLGKPKLSSPGRSASLTPRAAAPIEQKVQERAAIKRENLPFTSDNTTLAKSLNLVQQYIQTVGRDDRLFLTNIQDPNMSRFPTYLSAPGAFNRDLRACSDLKNNPLLNVASPYTPGGLQRDIMMQPAHINAWSKAVMLAGRELAPPMSMYPPDGQGNRLFANPMSFHQQQDDMNNNMLGSNYRYPMSTGNPYQLMNLEYDYMKLITPQDDDSVASSFNFNV